MKFDEITQTLQAVADSQAQLSTDIDALRGQTAALTGAGRVLEGAATLHQQVLSHAVARQAKLEEAHTQLVEMLKRHLERFDGQDAAVKDADERPDARAGAHARYEARLERLEEAFRHVAESYQTLVHLAVIHDERLGEHNEANTRTESLLDALIDAQMQLTADTGAINGRFDKVAGALEALVSAQTRTDELFRLMLERNGSAATLKTKVKKAKKKGSAK